MSVAGCETVFVNMLKAFDTKRYSVSVFTTNNCDPIINLIPSDVDVFFQEDYSSRRLFLEDLKAFKISRIMKGLFYRGALRVSRDKFRKEVFAAKTHLLLEEQFDLVIAYKPAEIPYALYQFSSLKRAVWFHTFEFDGNPYDMDRYVINTLNSFDKIYCVSQSIKDRLNSYPDLEFHKTEVFHNIMDKDWIIRKADMEAPEIDSSFTRIVTVARLVKEKRVDRIIAIAQKLIEEGYGFHWYVVGDGPEKKKLLEMVVDSKLDGSITFLGYKENPYPYINACDIYVQTSEIEGYCTTTMEAKILEKPVVTTDAPGMREQFTDGVDGLITDMSEEGLAAGIKQLMDDSDFRESIIKKLKKENNNNNQELVKLYQFIDEP